MWATVVEGFDTNEINLVFIQPAPARQRAQFQIPHQSPPMRSQYLWYRPITEWSETQDFLLYASPTSLVVEVFPLDLLWEILPQQV